MRKLLLWILGAPIILGGMLMLNYWSVSNCGGDRIYQQLDGLPPARVAVLLGTSRGAGEQPFGHYQQRIDAAVAWAQTGKIKVLVVSGTTKNANGENEVALMQADLQKAGVPIDMIRIDSLGENTRASVANSAQFAEPTLFISQRSHLERVVCMASNTGIKAYGLDAGEYDQHSLKMREVFARLKMRF